MGQRQQVVVALEVALAALAVGVFTRVSVRVPGIAAVREAIAAVTGFVEFVLLQHGTHRAVEHKDAFGERGVQFLHAIRVQVGKLIGHEDSPKSIYPQMNANERK